MNDLFLEWAGDIAASPTGDIATATGSDAINQRVCRRLLTNAGEYLWELDYGASLGLFVGSPGSATDIDAVIRSQLALESSVPAGPPPTVSVTVADPANGIFSATITYASPEAGTPVAVSITTPTS